MGRRRSLVSNDVFLVGGTEPDAPGPLCMGSEYTYDYYGQDTIAGSSYSIPLLWLFCFDLMSLTEFDCSTATGEPGTVVSAVIPIGRGRELLHGRSPLMATWPGLERYYPEFVDLIESCHFKYLKMDLFELNEMMDDLDERLRVGLAWLERGPRARDDGDAPSAPARRRGRQFRRDRAREGDAGLEALHEIAYFQPDDSHASTMAHGFKCNREVPWQDPA